MGTIEIIANAINATNKTRVEISRDTGVDEAVLCRIVNGGSCSVKTIDKLCDYLNLQLQPKKQRATK